MVTQSEEEYEIFSQSILSQLSGSDASGPIHNAQEKRTGKE